MTEPWSRRYSLWRIKSPWLRLPVAWMYVAASLLTYAVFCIAMVAVGSVKGARDGFDEWRDVIRWPGMWSEFWTAMTSWSGK